MFSQNLPFYLQEYFLGCNISTNECKLHKVQNLDFLFIILSQLLKTVPDELWMEVHDIVQETGIKTIAMEMKCKKAKWPSGEALQIAVKRE